MMRAHTKSGVVGAALLLVACSAEPTAPPDSVRGVDVPAVDPAPPAAATKYVSFVPETAPGEAPALVRFHNTTSARMTLWFDQITFFAVPSGATIGPDVASSADVKTDATVGVHQEDSALCVMFRLNEYEGPSALAPGASYTMDLFFIDRVTGYRAVLKEVASERIVALRAEVHDSKATDARPSVLRVELAGPNEALQLETYDATRGFYTFAKSESRTAHRISFVDGSGTRFEARETVVLDAAPGYTAIVGDAPAAGAAVVAKLTETK
jgi:hypothetical protein